MRFGVAMLLAVMAASSAVELIGCETQLWKLALTMVVGGLAGGLTFTAVNDGPRALGRALRRGRS